MTKISAGKYAIFAIAFSSVLALSTGISGCKSTPTQRSTGETLDDATITARVKTEIASAQGLGEALKINVDTYRGVVSLSGFVDSAEQIAKATSVAQGCAGVKQVKNNLTVKPKN
jgi:osmotically-inducible protein OsmY